tara:strand:+ start:257 stop:511 length:255 start_codon:yes stop_codon:yes gene_type:complete
MEKENLSEVFKKLKVVENLPEDVDVALKSFATACEAMMEFEIEHIPTEYFVNLINALGNHSKYRAMANHLALIVLKDMGFFDDK